MERDGDCPKPRVSASLACRLGCSRDFSSSTGRILASVDLAMSERVTRSDPIFAASGSSVGFRSINLRGDQVSVTSGPRSNATIFRGGRPASTRGLRARLRGGDRRRSNRRWTISAAGSRSDRRAEPIIRGQAQIVGHNNPNGRTTPPVVAAEATIGAGVAAPPPRRNRRRTGQAHSRLQQMFVRLRERVGRA